MVQFNRRKLFLHILLILIFLLSFLVRANRFDYPLSHIFKWGDGTRDFLVAQHILKFGEYPLVGPYNLLEAYGIYSSPIYFYALAFFLRIYDHILFLSLINIFFQMATLLIIYLCVKKIFDQKIALVSMLFYSFIPEVIKQADFVWQPFLMQPVAYLGLLFLIYGYINKSKKMIFLSMVTLIVASALYHAAFSWLPLFLILAIYFFKKEKISRKYLLGILISLILISSLLYLPVLILYAKHNINPQNFLFCQNSCLHVFSVKNYLANLNYNFNQFFAVFSIKEWFIYPILLLGLFFSYRNRLLLLTYLLMILPILFSSLFNKSQLHYISFTLPLFAVLVSVLITKIFARYMLNSSIKIMAVIFIFVVFSFNLNFFYTKKLVLENFQLINKATNKVVDELTLLKSQGDFKKMDFFQVVTYEHSNIKDRPSNFHYQTLDTILLAPLEKNLNIRLVSLDDLNGYNHVQINHDDYIVLVCMEYLATSKIDDCRAPFLKDYPAFIFIKKVYTKYPLEINLMKKI